MTATIIVLNFLSLIVQIVGSYFMFVYSPENRTGGDFPYDTEENVSRKNKLFKRGFFILGIGFILSLLSLIIKTIQAS